MDIKTIPKVELHSHLDGILSPQMVRDIRATDPDFPIDPTDFDGFLPVNDLETFWNWYQVISPIEGHLEHFFPVIAQYIALLKESNVRYSEVMIAHGELPRDIAEAVDRLTAFREWVNRQEAGQIQVEFLVGIGRTKPVGQWPDIEARVLALHDAGLIVGVALAGMEIGYPVKPLHRHFARFHEAGLPIEIHAGEWAGSESVWDALENGFPDRIGHGVSLFDDPRLIEIFQERQMHIEVCPTSNLRTGSVKRLEDHPIRRARELGLNFSINTDDCGPFQSTMNSEYELAARVFGFDEDDFRRIYANALAARFQPELRGGGAQLLGW